MYIGCGGWAYWQVDREFQSSSDRLEDYATVFDFVEVNNTYYQIPTIEEAKSWRKRVPVNFEFAVKCNRQVSHQNPLASNESNFELIGKMEAICKVLKAVGLVIQTPVKFRPTAENLEIAEEFFSNLNQSKVNMIWEPRGDEWALSSVKGKLENLLSHNNITHCTDISKMMPIQSGNISYSRIFGKGVKNQWQFDDEEIQDLHSRAQQLPQAAYLAFHTQRQTHDAARMKAFDDSGRLINTTGQFEVNSVLVAVDEYRKYPITKNELLTAHGWKIIDIAENKRIRANIILQKLPDIEFQSRNELKSHVEKLFRAKGQKKLDEF